MCGIAGFVSAADAPDAPAGTLAEMTRRLAHRGPDAHGLFEQGAVHFGHTRLSIIDLAGGPQPMSTADGRLTVVFNGEIYNFRELRDELERARPSLPHRRRHRGAAARLERVGRGAASTGCAACSRSRSGTRATRTLLLARDRLGIKPLYYACGRRDASCSPPS